MRTASFRGIEFDWEEAPLAFGRQTAVHQYPDRVNRNGVVAESRPAYIEDPTTKVRTLRLVALFTGPNCESDADALRDACDAPGPGRLVHPILGEMDAICDAGTQSIDQTSNVARLELSFQEAGRADLAAERSVEGVADDATTEAIAEAAARAQAAWNAAQSIAGTLTDCLDVVTAGLAAIETAWRRAASPELAATIKGRVGALGLQAASLVATPADLATQWVGIFEGAPAVDVLRLAPTIGTLTSDNAAAAADADLLTTATVAAACTAALAAPGESDVDARSMADRLNTTILALAAAATSPDQRAGLVAMAAATSTALDSLAGTLPRLKVINLTRPVPLLVLVADLFPGQDPEAAALTILRRNAHANALVVPPGRLEVVNA
jgi:prophage DNA circulation protein